MNEYLRDSAYTPIDVNYKDRKGYTALHHACLNGHDSLVEGLVNHGANLQVLTPSQQTPLMLACQQSLKSDSIKCLIHHGANVDAKDVNGNGPLHYASGNVRLIQLLVSC